MIQFGAMGFGECYSEEVLNFFWLSVYLALQLQKYKPCKQ